MATSMVAMATINHVVTVTTRTHGGGRRGHVPCDIERARVGQLHLDSRLRPSCRASGQTPVSAPTIGPPIPRGLQGTISRRYGLLTLRVLPYSRTEVLTRR